MKTLRNTRPNLTPVLPALRHRAPRGTADLPKADNTQGALAKYLAANQEYRISPWPHPLWPYGSPAPPRGCAGFVLDSKGIGTSCRDFATLLDSEGVPPVRWPNGIHRELRVFLERTGSHLGGMLPHPGRREVVSVASWGISAFRARGSGATTSCRSTPTSKLGPGCSALTVSRQSCGTRSQMALPKLKVTVPDSMGSLANPEQLLRTTWSTSSSLGSRENTDRSSHFRRHSLC